MVCHDAASGDLDYGLKGMADMARLTARMPSLRRLVPGGAIASAIVLSAMAVPGPALAQSSVNGRLDQIERQLRAIQRKVFPGGDDRFFEPEITAQPATQQPNVATPSTSALTDVLSRVTGLESELARLTAATEVNQNALAQLEQRIARLEGGSASGTSMPSTVPSTLPSSGSSTTPAPRSTGVLARPPAQQAPSQPSGVIPLPSNTYNEEEEENAAELPPVAAQPSPARVSGVQAIAKPATGDMGDDEYVYGFRLWEARYYDEAQQQLALFVERYPDHWRTTYGRNLLGRAYLDDKEPREAATQFYENYRDDPQGARAPDSLLYLGEAMIALGDSDRACIALAEFGDTYPALATGRLKSQYDSNRKRVDCR